VTHCINFNGNIIRSDQPVIAADNRGFRYGDGIFETIRIQNNLIVLADYHFDRLFTGMKLLQLEQPDFFTPSELSKQIKELCKKNDHRESARVRLVVFRGNGGLYDPENHFPNYIIQSWPLSNADAGLNKEGLDIGIFENGKKAIDDFSNLKSNNYLLYAMGALYAKTNKLSDCLILNGNNRICDSTKANVFCVKDKIIFTPPLSEGCVAGVIRRYFLVRLPETGFTVVEKEINVEFLRSVDEIFLTNALFPIQWVKSFNGGSYKNEIASSVFEAVIRNMEPQIVL